MPIQIHIPRLPDRLFWALVFLTLIIVAVLAAFFLQSCYDFNIQGFGHLWSPNCPCSLAYPRHSPP